MIHTAYFGYVDIEPWEYSLMVLYLVVLYVYFARQKNVKIKKRPEYKYFLWGLFAKLFGGIAFSLIYFYYYKGGDTISYFYSGMALSNLAKADLGSYLHVLFGENSEVNRQFFNMETGYPYYFVYFDSRAYMIVRMISVLILMTFNSYLITTIIVSSISYIGIWRFYQTLVRYYPSLKGQLAIAVLFMPSSIFWGSAILKDTFTFSALCWFLHCIDNLAFRRQEQVLSVLGLVVSTFLLVSIKPYIFMVLLPVTLLWLSYQRLSMIRSILIKYFVLPIVLVGLGITTLYVLTLLDQQLGKFSLNDALNTIVISQQDLVRVEEYGENYFTVGEIEDSWLSVFSHSPEAVIAGMFRPFIWECRSVVMVLAGLENLFMLVFMLIVLIRSRVVFFFSLMAKNPLILTFFLFVVGYAFVIGVTTPNFGALVRFKIPMIPLLVSALYISSHILKQRQRVLRSGHKFRFEVFKKGEPAMLK